VNRHDPRRNSGFTICDAHIERLASRAPLKTAPAADVPASASIRVPAIAREFYRANQNSDRRGASPPAPPTPSRSDISRRDISRSMGSGDSCCDSGASGWHEAQLIEQDSKREREREREIERERERERDRERIENLSSAGCYSLIDIARSRHPREADKIAELR